MNTNICRDLVGLPYWFSKPQRSLIIIFLLCSTMIFVISKWDVKISGLENVPYVNSLVDFSSKMLNYGGTLDTGDILKTVIFICIDSKHINENEDMVTVVKNWYAKEAVVHECQNSIECSIRLVFYRDDIKTISANVRKEIKQIFSLGGVTLTAEPQNIAYEIKSRENDARSISDFMIDLYVKGFDYFLLVSTPQMVCEDKIQPSPSLKGLTNKLSSQTPKDVGIIRFICPNTNKFDTTLVGFLFSKLHIEIFGAAFRYSDIPSLKIAFDYVSRIYPRALTTTFSLISNEIDSRETFSNKSTLMPATFISEQNDTLTRYLKAVETSKGCLRCNLRNSKKIIAMSLYGINSRYTLGALRNAQLFPVIFPGWRLWFYIEKEPPIEVPRMAPPAPQAIISRLEELQAEFRYIDTQETGLAPMLWRFSAAEDPEVEYLSVRDCDGRLTPRDAAVVQEWIKSGKAFHCIRDHPSHSVLPINGGLWGGRPALLKQIFNNSLLKLMKGYGAAYGDDMNFLNSHLWPKVKDNHAYCHDSFTCTSYQSSHPFPVVRKEFEHLGQVYNYRDMGRESDIATLRSRAVNKQCIPK